MTIVDRILCHLSVHDFKFQDRAKLTITHHDRHLTRLETLTSETKVEPLVTTHDVTILRCQKCGCEKSVKWCKDKK